MSILFRRITVSMLVTLVLIATSMWAAGVGFARTSDSQDTTRVPTMSAKSVSVVEAAPAPPSMADLQELADYISPDGRYVKIGPVEISTTPVVTRASLD